MLKNLLEQKKGFKLVCGAGNEDIEEVKKLVTIYSLAGCRFFDISANFEIVKATKEALKNLNKDKECYICVSVGIDGDPHINKANINQNLCTNCQACIKTCPHDAIIKENTIKINTTRCIGCSQCLKKFPQNAISMYSQLQDYNEILPKIIELGIDCIEFHAISTDNNDVMEKWKLLNKLYDGLLCISLDRSELGDKNLIDRVKKMIEIRKPFSTIIQADGIAMSGNNDELGTTLQAIATAQLFQNANLPAYIMMSGGTNTKSSEYAKKFGVSPHCIAIGSFARKIVKEYLKLDNLLENKEALNNAVKIATKLVNTSLEHLSDD